MIRHIWTVLCQKSILDHDTNNLTLVDVAEQIVISIADLDSVKLSAAAVQPMQETNAPSVTLRLELVSLWARQKKDRPEKGHARIRIMAPSSEIMYEMTYEINLSASTRFRQRSGLMGLPPAIASGEYIFITELLDPETNEYVIVAETPLEISFPA